ncbi:hypothetical protein V498_06373 [Pseudogymnoascus sp. VKM F-4517 (FW-2822)]|nr:hypothetical protein V498_06373 [Pseudogymnoascus sp. VKM F-4517 (FW-2822)]
MLKPLIQLQIPRPLRGAPAQHHSHIIHQPRLAELLHALLVVRDVDQRQQHTQRVFAPQPADAVIHILWMQTMVLQAQEERTRRRAQNVVRGRVAPFPRLRAQVREHGVSLLPVRDVDCGAAGARGQGLGGWLHDLGAGGGCRGGGARVEALRRRLGDAWGGVVRGDEGGEELGVGPKFVVAVHGVVCC